MVIVDAAGLVGVVRLVVLLIVLILAVSLGRLAGESSGEWFGGGWASSPYVRDGILTGHRRVI